MLVRRQQEPLSVNPDAELLIRGTFFDYSDKIRTCEPTRIADRIDQRYRSRCVAPRQTGSRHCPEGTCCSPDSKGSDARSGRSKYRIVHERAGEKPDCCRRNSQCKVNASVSSPLWAVATPLKMVAIRSRQRYTAEMLTLTGVRKRRFQNCAIMKKR